MKQKLWLDDSNHVRRLWRGFLAVLALTVVAELAVDMRPHFPVEALFGFNAAFGFLACAALILIARILGMLLKRPDDYYKRND